MGGRLGVNAKIKTSAEFILVRSRLRLDKIISTTLMLLAGDEVKCCLDLLSNGRDESGSTLSDVSPVLTPCELIQGEEKLMV